MGFFDRTWKDYLNTILSIQLQVVTGSYWFRFITIPMNGGQNDYLKNRMQVIHLLLRKEVIHPHLPVGIPCYDLILIADSTLDRLSRP